MPATAWDLFCSAWFSVISHWLTANSSFGHRSCSLSGWQCLVVLLCSARFIFSVCLSQASAFLWPAMWPALRYRGPNNALLMQTAIWRCGTDEITPKCAFRSARLASHSPKISLPSAVAFYTIVVELRNGDLGGTSQRPDPLMLRARFDQSSGSISGQSRSDVRTTLRVSLLSSLWCHPRGSILIAAFCRLAKSLSYSEQMGWWVGAVGIEHDPLFLSPAN
jgi:hypothetical protein